MQGKAEPNTIVISAETYHLVQGFFACANLGPQDLKGISAPLTLYHVQGTGEAQNRFDVSVQKGLTPLVGREEENELLLRRWQRAKGGEGQVVLLNGEAGIGKSRLVQVLREQIKDEPQLSVICRCSPFYQNSALYPIIDRLQRFLQLGKDDTPATKQTKLSQALEPVGLADTETISLFASLLSIPLPEDHPALQLSPQKQKEKTLHALVAWVTKTSEQTPVRVEIEDLHWVDPTTLELLGLLIEQVPSFRILVLLTFRPEFTPPWPTQSHMLPMQLSHLPHTQIADMIVQVSGKALPSDLIQQLVTKSDGVPLYVEEMTKNLLESGLLKEVNGHFETTGPLPQLAIPTTLQDSFASRLDRLAPVRELAQIGAVLGREFSYELIHAVAKLDETTLQAGLKQLGAAEILYQRGVPPQATYSFKHALLQDASYESLLKSKRQQLHTQTAQVLEERFPEAVRQHPEIVAHHYTGANLLERAIPYWQQAGQKSLQTSAYREAISHLSKGIELLQKLPEDAERIQPELSLQLALGAASIATRGYLATEAEDAYERAVELCDKVENPELIQMALHGARVFHLIRGDYQLAHQFSERIFQLAKHGKDVISLNMAHNLMGESFFYQGEFVPARYHLEKGIKLYDVALHQSRRTLSMLWIDTGVAALAYAGQVLWYLGYPNQAQRRGAEAVSLARQLSHPFSLSFALTQASRCFTLCQNMELSRELAEEGKTLSKENGFVHYLWATSIVLGWVSTRQGQLAGGISAIEQGLVSLQTAGTEVLRPLLLTWLAEAYSKAGEYKEALKYLREALTVVEKNSERSHEAEVHRLTGEVLFAQDARNQQEAETCFQQALTVAQQRSAKSLELRVATSLARLWQQQGKTTQARDLLAPVYNWFTEGFDTQDLKDAKALLDELNQNT